jgi:P63C domain
MADKKRKVKYEGELDLNGLKIPCYVLEDGTRILSGRGMQETLKMVDIDEDSAPTSGTRLNRYLEQKSLQPYIYKDKGLGHFEPIECIQGGKKINGYEATILADICDGFLEARKHIKLSKRQDIIATQCEILIRAFAKVGIIALVDEATGYQYDRERYELQRILKAYISEELLVWQQRFPHEYYKQIFRLNNWDYTVANVKTKPSVIGKWTNKYVYKQLPKGVLEELKKKTPIDETGKRKHHFHRLLTQDTGHPHLDKQLTQVITIMKLSKNWRDFLTKFNQLFGQTSMFTDDE